MAASDTDDEYSVHEDEMDSRKYRIEDAAIPFSLPAKEPPSYEHNDNLQKPSPPQSRGGTPHPYQRQDSSSPLDTATTTNHNNNNSNNNDNDIDIDIDNDNDINDNIINNSTNDVYYDPDTEWLGARSSRAPSIYSISRVSLTNQLAHLTSIQLPNAASLSAKISSLPTSAAAAKALSESVEQIRSWMRNAMDVLQGLDADDDVEWAAAAGREGLNEVDKAIGRFENIIKVYVLTVEELQMRPDISAVPIHDLTGTVTDMDGVMREWRKIKDSLGNIKEQVEIAMEWEELWNNVLGAGIAQELDNLARLVFEMEEKRHQTVASDKPDDCFANIDIDQLKTIVEETSPASPSEKRPQRYSLPPPFTPSSARSSPGIGNMEDGLLGLFARMQPLRASLDFLPMRLSVFHIRGNPVFPSACLTLETRRDSLEAQWKKLEADAEALRRELGEDRWLLVFRNAGRQALNMCESVSRSMEKLTSAVESSEQHADTTAIARTIESYEAKKTHYGPAIERVLAIVDQGVLGRLTVNGEILGLQSDMKRKWARLQSDMRDLDSKLLDMNVNLRNQQLRDSISTILSSEQSMANSLIDTPRSSSASSLSHRSSQQHDSTPRRGTPRLFKTSLPRKTPLSNPKTTPSTQPSPSARLLRPISPTLSPVQYLRQFKPPTDKPRWNSSTISTPREFSPLSVTEPSPYRKTPSRQSSFNPISSPSKIPTPSPLSRSVGSTSHLPVSPAGGYSSPRRVTTPGPGPGRSHSSLATRLEHSRANTRSSTSLGQGRSFMTPFSARRSESFTSSHTDDSHTGAGAEIDTRLRRFSRAPSAMGMPSGRKGSSLAPPQSSGDGRRSRSSGKLDEREHKHGWRF